MRCLSSICSCLLPYIFLHFILQPTRLLQSDIIRLRYLATAYRYRNRAAIGYVNVLDPRCLKTVDRFKVSDALTTLLVFQEFVPSSLDEFPTPVASAEKEQLDLGWIHLSSFSDLAFEPNFVKLFRK